MFVVKGFPPQYDYFQRNNQNNGFMPFGQPSELPDFQPNNNFKYGNNFGQNQNSNNNNNDFNWNPNFNWNNNQNNNNNNAPNKQAPMNNAGVGATTTPDFNPFQPNPNQQFVFNFNKNQGGQNNQNNHVNNNNHNQNIPVLESKPKVATLGKCSLPNLFPARLFYFLIFGFLYFLVFSFF